MLQLPPFIQDLLSTPPRAGDGVHNWVFRVARHLHPHMPEDKIVSLLKDRVAGCGRNVPINEIEDAVRNSARCAWRPATTRTSGPLAKKWPNVNCNQRAEIIRTNGGLADLWECSPVRIEDNNQHTEEIIDRLFPHDALLCCGASQFAFDTRPREQWRAKLAHLQFIVPNPMTARFGKKQHPMPGTRDVSAHTLDNTGPRRFLVCEFDGGTLDEQAGLMLHLSALGPLVLVLHSGGKSLHGWFLAEGKSEEMLRRFFHHAVSLGADPTTWTRSQFVRMPDGTRDSGEKQAVYFLNLSLMKVQ